MLGAIHFGSRGVDRLRETSIQRREMVLALAERIAGLGYALWDERTKSYVFVSEQYADSLSQGAPIPAGQRVALGDFEDLDEVLRVALERRPDDRYSSALELRGAISRLLD